MSKKTKEICFTLLVGVLLAFGLWYIVGNFIMVFVCGFSNERDCSQDVKLALSIVPSIVIAAGFTGWRLHHIARS